MRNLMNIFYNRSVSVTITMQENGDVYKYSKGLPYDINPDKSSPKVFVTLNKHFFD